MGIFFAGPWYDRVKRPTYVTNRAITIDAPPRLIWPWLAQLGELPRGGFYSYDWIEQLMGMKVSTRLLPQHQRLEVRQALDRTGNMLVKAAEPEHFLVLGPSDRVTDVESTGTRREFVPGSPPQPGAGGYCCSWTPGSSSWNCSGSSSAPSALGRGDVRCRRSTRP